jgi:hypothetical protein
MENYLLVGFSIDYYIGNRYIGSVPVEQPDRALFGFRGRQTVYAPQLINFNNTFITQGTKVITELTPVIK